MKKIISLMLCALFINTLCPLNAFAIEETTTEHLNLPKKLAKKVPTNIVKTSDSSINIISYNVLPLVFTQSFTSQNARLGDEIVFMLKEDLLTTEGTVVLPAGTRVIAEISDLKEPEWFNRCGKVYLKFKELELDGGARIPIKAELYGKKVFLSRGKLNALGKGVGSVFSTMAVGTAAGCGIGIAAGTVVAGGLAVGMPIGFGVGALGGVITPGLYYKAKVGDKINVQLVNDLILEK